MAISRSRPHPRAQSVRPDRGAPREHGRRPPVAEGARVAELPGALGLGVLPGDVLPVLPAQPGRDPDGLAAGFVDDVPLDAEELRAWLGPLHLRPLSERRSPP